MAHLDLGLVNGVWMGPDRSIVQYYVSSGRTYNWIGISRTKDAARESWLAEGSVEDALAEPVRIGAIVTSGRASIGIATASPGTRLDAEALLNLADAEMYLTKRSRQEAGSWPPDVALPWA